MLSSSTRRTTQTTLIQSLYFLVLALVVPAALLLTLFVPSANALSPIADVGVIGAGPAGLALAHSLRNEGHTVKIFERRSSFRPVGAAVFLHPFALNSLRKVSPRLEQQLLSVSTQIHTLSFKTLAASSGAEGFGFALRNLQDAEQVFGAPFVAVRFWDMLKALKSGLPEEMFCFGHQLDHYEAHEGGGGSLLVATRH